MWVSEIGSVVKVSGLGCEDPGSIPAGDCASFIVPEQGLDHRVPCVLISTQNTEGFPRLAISYWITMLNIINNNISKITFLLFSHLRSEWKVNSSHKSFFSIWILSDKVCNKYGISLTIFSVPSLVFTFCYCFAFWSVLVWNPRRTITNILLCYLVFLLLIAIFSRKKLVT